MSVSKIVTIVLTSVSVILLVVSAIVPPPGVIDPSILAAVGEIFAFSSLWFAKDAFHNDGKATIKHRDTILTVEADEHHENNNNIKK